MVYDKSLTCYHTTKSLIFNFMIWYFSDPIFLEIVSWWCWLLMLSSNNIGVKYSLLVFRGGGAKYTMSLFWPIYCITNKDKPISCWFKKEIGHGKSNLHHLWYSTTKKSHFFHTNPCVTHPPPKILLGFKLLCKYLVSS